MAPSTRLCAEHSHSWLHTQQEGSGRGSVHSLQRHLPQRSHSNRCFFSAGDIGRRGGGSGTLCWLEGTFAVLLKLESLLKEEVEEEAVEVVSTLALVEVKLEEVMTWEVEEVKQPGGWWSTVGGGTAWSSSR